MTRSGGRSGNPGTKDGTGGSCTLREGRRAWPEDRVTRTWHVPPTLPAGDYAVVVEVNKEYDGNDSHQHPAYQDENLPTYGVDGNFGQPSVLSLPGRG